VIDQLKRISIVSITSECVVAGLVPATPSDRIRSSPTTRNNMLNGNRIIVFGGRVDGGHSLI